MMRRTNFPQVYGIFHVVLIIAACFVSSGYSSFELCTPGKSNHVYHFTTEKCPSGVLFAYPVIAGCMASSHSTDYYFTDLCDEKNYLFDMDMKPFKVHLAFGNESLEIDPESSCAQLNVPGKCNTSDLIVADASNFVAPDRRDPCDTDFADLNLTEEEQSRRSDPKVFNQTERLFKYMTGLIPAPRRDIPEPRIVKILKLCFEILSLQCSTSYVPQMFSDDILKAFMYLFRDSDLTALIDMPPADFEIVQRDLNRCKQVQTSPFTVIGQICKNCSYGYAIQKDNQSIRYVEDEFSFSWGRHDVVVDAVWTVLTFSHGLCYGTFRLNTNAHHLFQRAAEMLFTPEIQYRWIRPPELAFEDIWDNMFSAPVRNTMRNLDVCVGAAYFNVPFLHRLERPTRQPVKDRRRKKRSLPVMNLEKGGLHMAGWCFQTREDLMATVTAYVNLYCPNVRKPLDELSTLLTEKPPGETVTIDTETQRGSTEGDAGGSENNNTNNNNNEE